MSSEVAEIKDQFADIQKKYQQYLPKVDPALIHDLLLRQSERPDVTPMYMVEVFTKPGLNAEEVRNYILEKTGMSPAIYDNGTHYATNQKLTLEMLKEISESDEVLEVTGEYTGGLGGYAVSHEHAMHEKRQYAPPSLISGRPRESTEPRAQALSIKSPDRQSKSKYRIAIYTAIGIIGAIALAGFIISGGNLPNSQNNQAIPAGTEPGLLHGYVAGPQGLPAIGASVLAVKQGEAFAASEFVSVNGQYEVSVPPGNYIIVATYPDGTEKIVNDINVERGSNQELNFAY
jgi:hypothetical protein